MSHLGERLSALIDGELSHAQRDRALAHLATCEPCRLEAAALRALKRRMRALGEATAHAGLTDRLMALAVPGPAAAYPGDGPAAAGSRWPLRSLALAALAVLALAIPAAAFVAGGAHREPGPSVTPPVDLFVIQHAIGTGAVPAAGTPASATPAAAASPRLAAQRLVIQRLAIQRPANQPLAIQRPAAQRPAGLRPAGPRPATQRPAGPRPAGRHAVVPRAW